MFWYITVITKVSSLLLLWGIQLGFRRIRSPFVATHFSNEQFWDLAVSKCTWIRTQCITNYKEVFRCILAVSKVLACIQKSKYFPFMNSKYFIVFRCTKNALNSAVSKILRIQMNPKYFKFRCIQNAKLYSYYPKY